MSEPWWSDGALKLGEVEKKLAGMRALYRRKIVADRRAVPVVLVRLALDRDEGVRAMGAPGTRLRRSRCWSSWQGTGVPG